LAAAWTFVTPVFETPDEDAHVRYVQFLADAGRLPDPRVDGASAGNESFHPPLYYATLAAVLKASGIAYAPVSAQRVAGWTWENVETFPRNYFELSPQPHGYVYLLRGLSVLFGVVTVICTYVAATLVGGSVAIRAVATAATATLPQFTFMSGAVNPDSLAAALCSVGLVLLLRLLKATVPRAAGVVAFGLVAGLAVLSEYHTIFLLPLAVIGYAFLRQRRARLLMRDGVLAGTAFVAVTGWWFGLNFVRYGDASGLSMQRLLAPELLTPRSLFDPYFLVYFPTLTAESFLGVFGWLSAFLPAAVYGAYAVLWIIALWGIGHGIFVGGSWSPERKALVVAPILVLGLVLYANLTFIAPQGRYFFPALVALSVIFAFGLSELPRRFARAALLTAPLFLLAANVYSLILVATSFVRN
jgi:4-amino-4-deoxy-L-arabinose transferase-like glycosyltransferase